MRVLCLSFPRLSMQLLLKQRPEIAGKAIVMVSGDAEAARVSAVSNEAAARGVVVGMTPGHARARCAGVLFAVDNAGACLDELERIASIIQVRATSTVAIVSREELLVDVSGGLPAVGGDEAEVAERLAGLAAMWTGLNVRAGVASSRAEARRAARCARLGPVVRPPVLAWGEPPLQAASAGPLAVEVRFPLRTSPLAARARLVRAIGQLQALLDGGGWSYREVRARVVGPDGERELRRLMEPSCDAQAGVEALGTGLDDQVLTGADFVRLELGRLGPDVRVVDLGEQRELLRAG